ncbi:DUF2252 domain-containing protein [Tessaracoccus sp. G1721]
MSSVEALTPARRKGSTAKSATFTASRARGREAREEVPLEDHAVFSPTSLRPDPLELLERQGADRVPELLPIRYGRMVSSPFAFYRGGALLMAADLASTTNSGLRVQLCGDAHVSNFGFYASPERNLVFDLNDFDETLPGPFEWDVKRLAASLEIAARSQSFSDRDARSIVLSAVRGYREAMIEFAAMPTQAVWYSRLDAKHLLAELRGNTSPQRLRKTQTLLEKAPTRDSVQAFSKFTKIVDGQPRIISVPPLIMTLEDLLPAEVAEALLAQMGELLAAYRRSLSSDRQHLFDQYRFVHMARKVVGVGSVGTRAWILLLEGAGAGDPLVLQAKEAQSSVLEQFLGVSEYTNHGERVVAGQRLLQAASDIFLGWQRTNGIDGVDRDYYVRQLRDWKASAEVEGASPGGSRVYARICGWTLARAHARSGERVAIASYLGKRDTFDEAVAAFAVAYADQNDKDHAALRAAIDDGRIQAQEGV